MPRTFLYFSCLCTLLCLRLSAQTLFVPLRSPDERALDRLEIQQGTDSSLNFSKFRPYLTGRSVKDVLGYINRPNQFPAAELYNLRSFVSQYPFVEDDSLY